LALEAIAPSETKMKIASKMMTDNITRRTHLETLIQTELGAYFIVEEDLNTGEVTSHRISMEQAYEFQEIAKSQTAQEINLPEVR
jgi:hypothetical protein